MRQSQAELVNCTLVGQPELFLHNELYCMDMQTQSMYMQTLYGSKVHYVDACILLLIIRPTIILIEKGSRKHWLFDTYN